MKCRLSGTGLSGVVMVLSYGVWSIGSTLWDPHHIDLLYSVIPRDSSRAFFGTLSSVKRILVILILPLATALSEADAGTNYALASLLYLLALISYRWILRNGTGILDGPARQQC